MTLNEYLDKRFERLKDIVGKNADISRSGLDFIITDRGISNDTLKRIYNAHFTIYEIKYDYDSNYDSSRFVIIIHDDKLDNIEIEVEESD